MSHTPILQCLLIVARLSFMCAVRFSVPEEQGPGVLVGTLRPHFPSPYRLLTQDYLWLDSNTGSLYTTERRMDREELCPKETRADGCIIPCTAIVGATEDLVQFSVIIEDINDNAPHFENTEIHLSLSEDVSIGAEFLLDDLAQDSDIGSNGSIHYYIEESDGIFKVTADDGGWSVKLVVKAPLDRETQDEYNISLVAKDMGSPSLTAVVALRITVTDINDNCPSFSPDSRQSVTISGDSLKNTAVAQVKATDPDFGTNAVITYDFSPKVSERARVLFSLDSLTGSIILTQDLHSDIFEKLVLKVLASGPHCSPADTQVTVSVLPRAKEEPTIKIGFIARHENQTLVVAENEPPTTLAVLELEGDRGSSLNIVGEVPFTLSHQSGKYLLSNSKPLDYEEMKEHHISILVQRFDQGSVITISGRVIRVVVTDVNDNPPLFPVTFYELDVAENNQPGALLQVTASDADSGDNSRVTYRLGDNTNRNFNIDRNTGQLFVSVSLDREEQRIHTISVTAQDSGSPPLETRATVHIRVVDQNDNAPIFVMPHFIFFVPENAPVLAPVGAIEVTDADEGENGKVVLYVTNSSGPFVIPNSRKTLHITSSLDREVQDRFEFWVKASDNGSPIRLTSSVRVTVYIEDINDNQPKVILPVSNLTCLTVSPDTTAGTTITQVYAVDQDTGLNSELRYTVINQSRPFKVDSKTGNITLTQRLLGPDIGMHNIFVVVSDRGEPSPLHTAVWVNLFVNDSLETCHLDCEPIEPPWPPSPTTSESIGCPVDPGTGDSPNQMYVILFAGLGMVVISISLFVGTVLLHRRKKRSQKETKRKNKNENDIPLKLLDTFYSDE
ncbi:protocadherin-20 [Eucyclogobius newberryi]|uniref:protocadherin-20 n=1 Tax=Eucyclogobius newberryi TaxID=166745 RepID=UPI003B5A300C